MIPMLCDKARIAKQQKIETWLELYQLASKLGIKKSVDQKSLSPMNYVI
jgi:ribosomal protein S25